MGNIWTELATDFKAIKVKNIVRDILKELKTQILDINKQQLYFSGETSEGGTLGDYRPKTVDIKSQGRAGHDSRTANVTLRDTGDFYKSFKIKVTTQNVSIFATDDKTDMLVDRYGEDIFGLTQENWDEVVEQQIVPSLIKKIDELLA